MSHQHKHTREERGTTPAYLRPQNTLSTTEIPLKFSGEEAKQRLKQKPKGVPQNKAKQGTQGGRSPPTPIRP